MKRIQSPALILMFYTGIMITGLWLSSCGGKIETPLSEQEIKKELQDYFAQSQNISINVLGFSKISEKKYRAETTDRYLIKFFAEIELPPTDWGVIRKNIKGTLMFYKSSENWLFDDAQISTSNISIEVQGIKPYFFDTSPIFGINCPYDKHDFIRVHSDKCLGCEKNGREVSVTWAKTLNCLACNNTGICPYCNESPEESEMKCTKCDGNGKCNYCGGNYSKLGFDTPGKDFDEDCKYCNGTGECKYCLGTGIACYYCGSTQKCPFCEGRKSFSREDFNKEGRLIKTDN